MSGESAHTPPPRGRTLRPILSAISFWAAAVLAGFLLVDAAARGAGPVVLRWGPLILLIVWALWLAMYRTSVRLEEGGVRVHNLARVHEVPWSDVTAVVRGPQVVLQLSDGGRIVCAGSPFPRRPGMRVSATKLPGQPGVRPSSPKKDPQGEFLDALEVARDSAAPAAPLVRRTYWDLPALAAGAALALWTVLALILLG